MIVEELDKIRSLTRILGEYVGLSGHENSMTAWSFKSNQSITAWSFKANQSITAWSFKADKSVSKNVVL